jgi:MFS family permease
MFSVAVTMLLLSQARSLAAIVLLTGLAGWTGEFYRPASGALLADLVPPNQRVTAYSAHRLAFNAGWAFGPAAAGFLAASSFLWLFVGDALTSLLFGAVAWTLLPRGVRSANQEARWREAFSVMVRDPDFRRVLLANLVVALLYQQMASTYSLHVTKLGFADTIYGALLSLNGVLVVCCELPLTSLTQRFSPRRMIALGYLLLGAGFAANAFAHTVPALVAAMTLFTLGEMVNAPVTTAYVASLAPPDLRGRYMGALSFSGALAIMVGPGLGMALFQHSAMLVWIAGGLLGLLGASIILSGEERREPMLASSAKQPFP